jgi:hypothetical protein
MKYRKKPVVVDAFCWTGDNSQKEDPDWAIKAIESGEIYFENEGSLEVTLVVATLEDGRFKQAKHVADRGDYIIKGVKCELYPCKPDIFEMTYEVAE